MMRSLRHPPAHGLWHQPSCRSRPIGPGYAYRRQQREARNGRDVQELREWPAKQLAVVLD